METFRLELSYLVPLHHYIYLENSNGGYYKTWAKVFPGFIRAGDAELLDPMDFHGTNWYINQYAADNPLLSQRGGGGDVVLNVFTDAKGSLAHLYKDADSIAKDLGKPMAELSYPGGHAYKFVIPRIPRPCIAGPAFQGVLDARPRDFYAKADTFENVFIYPYWGGLVTPVRNRQWSHFEYVIDNTQQGSQKIQATIRYLNEGVGDKFVVTAQFDDENAVTVLDSRQALPTKGEGDALERQWQCNRYAPFSRLKLRCSMYADLKTPGYNGGNLDKVGFQKLVVTATPLSRDFFAPRELPFATFTENIQGVLSEDQRPTRWRWALGPRAVAVLNLPEAREVTFTFAFNNPIAGQTVLLTANGEPVWGGQTPLPAQKWMQGEIGGTVRFHGRKGANNLVFQFSRWNGAPVFFNEADRSPYAVAFVKLEYR